ncbi:MAG: FAD-dependent oxidoreductase [Candidatus Heimdallarchaeaceae archaeon]
MSKSKKKKKETDVIIVGGGIAGCVLAFHLANARLKVKVFEKQSRNEIDHDWCDSVEKEAFSYSGIPAPKGKERKRDRDHLAILSPDLESMIHLSHYDYWIVDRKLFLERLVELAEKAGAELQFETEIGEAMGRGQWVGGFKKEDGSIENARLVIDC